MADVAPLQEATGRVANAAPLQEATGSAIAASVEPPVRDEPERTDQPTVLIEIAEERRPLSRVTLVSLNPTTAANIEVRLGDGQDGAPVLSVGRAEGNTAVLRDQRVSYTHFLLRTPMRPDQAPGPEDKENARLELELVDLSTNGTWVNNYHVGKGKIVPVHSGDEISILPVTKVGRSQMIGYVVSDGRQRPPSTTPSRARRTARSEDGPSGVLTRDKPAWAGPGEQHIAGQRSSSPQFKSSGCLDLGQLKPRSKDDCEQSLGSTFVAELGAEVTCGICSDILHRTVALIPCLHNFCTSCYLEWRHRSSECPACRAQVTSVLRNHALNAVVGTFLKANPRKRREASELRGMDQRENEPLNRMLLAKLLASARSP